MSVVLAPLEIGTRRVVSGLSNEGNRGSFEGLQRGNVSIDDLHARGAPEF
jgi:hypothetical protein